MHRRSVGVRAFAKINLTLHVVGARPDGYHDLRTIFQSIDLHDTLTFSRAPGAFRLECDDPACSTGRANLVWRAAQAIWCASGRRGEPSGVVARIQKRIPIQGGLGGGSSDAAATLRALASLWRVPLTQSELSAAASTLGADVPYFLEGGTMLGLERGDLLFPLMDTPPAWVVLALPTFGITTKDAFAWWDQFEGGESAHWVANDLERPVAARHPVIHRLLRTLREAGSYHAAMSGSGSTVFGLFTSRTKARAAARATLTRTLVARTLNRTSYQRLAGIPPRRIHLPFAPRGSGHS